MSFGDSRRERAPSARTRRLRSDALVLEHPDPELTAAVEAAKQALVARLEDARSGAHATEIFAALTIGQHAHARAAFTGSLSVPAGMRPGLTRAWLAARYFGWTGDAAGARAWLPEAIAGLQEAAGPSVAEVARDLLALAEALGHAPAADLLRPLARGADPDRSADTVLSAPEDAFSCGLPDLLAGRTDAGIARWTASAGAATHDPARVLSTLVSAILGIDPDADRGRVRARLHVPLAWPNWAATNIHVGASGFDLRVRRDAGQVEITVDQTRGPLPLTLILEPTVHAPIDQVRVDHTPATLTLRPFADHIIAPVQLVLDTPRTLTLTLTRS